MKRGFKIGLALGAGGARGFAHIGIIKVLEAHCVPIDLITGTSMGAIIGAAFCLEPDIKSVEKKFLEIIKDREIKKIEEFFLDVTEANYSKLIIKRLLSKIRNLYLWNLRAARKWLIRSEPIIEVLKKLFNDRSFSDLKIPFACAAVDLNAACPVLIREGKILDALLSSSSIPGVFAPRKQGKHFLADGGILSLVPAKQARILGADFVIGVDLTPSISKRKILTGLDAMHQAEWVKSSYLNKLNLKYCDFVINPQVHDISWFAFSKAPGCIQQGITVASRYINVIKNSLRQHRRFYILRRLFSKREKYVD